MLKVIFCSKTYSFLVMFCLALAGFMVLPVPSVLAGPDFLDIGANARFNLGTKDSLGALSFENQTAATPYFVAGIGKIGQADKPGTDLYEQPSDKTLEDMEYKIGFGVDYSLGKNTGLNLGYQWSTGSTSEILKNGIESLNPDEGNQLFSLGIKVDF